MKKILLCLTFLPLGVAAQKVGDLPARGFKGEPDNVVTEKIAEDSLSSAFLIWIRGGVKHHFHTSHTENIYVIEGEGIMEWNDTTFTVKAGDYILVPRQTVHAVTAIRPMKVLSIQTPIWVTDDRTFVPPVRRPHNE